MRVCPHPACRRAGSLNGARTALRWAPATAAAPFLEAALWRRGTAITFQAPIKTPRLWPVTIHWKRRVLVGEGPWPLSWVECCPARRRVPGSCQCDFAQKWGLCELSQVQMRSWCVVTDVLVRRAKCGRPDMHRGKVNVCKRHGSAGHVQGEAETQLMHPQARSARGCWKPSEARKRHGRG